MVMEACGINLTAFVIEIRANILLLHEPWTQQALLRLVCSGGLRVQRPWAPVKVTLSNSTPTINTLSPVRYHVPLTYPKPHPHLQQFPEVRHVLRFHLRQPLGSYRQVGLQQWVVLKVG